MATAEDDTQLLGVPWRSRTVQVVLLSTVLAPLGVPLVSPALPVFRDTFGVSDAQASLIVSAYFAVGIVLSPFIGMIADRVGRKRVLVSSLFGFALTGGAAVFAPSFDALLLLRTLQGTAAAGLFITTITLIGDVFEGPRRNAVLGVNIAVLSTGAAVFPVIGGALVAYAWNVPFLLYLLAVPVGLFALRVLEEPSIRGESRGLSYIRGAFSSLRNRKAGGLLGAAFSSELLTFGSIITALPFILTDEFALSSVFVGLVVTVSLLASIMTASLNGWFARRLSNVGLVVSGFACYGVGLVVVWVAASPAIVTVGVLVYGAGLGLSMPAVDSGLGGIVPGQYRAGAFSLRNSTTFLGRASGPIVFAGLAGLVGGFKVLLLASGIATLGVVALVVLLVQGAILAPGAATEAG